MFLLAIEVFIILMFGLFCATQVFWPLWTGSTLFPILRFADEERELNTVQEEHERIIRERVIADAKRRVKTARQGLAADHGDDFESAAGADSDGDDD